MTRRKTKAHTPPPTDGEVKEIARDYKSLREDYVFDASIFNGEPEKVRLLKYILNHCLTEPERIVIILYADMHSYRKLGERLHLSHNVVGIEVRRIRKKIRDEYERLKNKEV